MEIVVYLVGFIMVSISVYTDAKKAKIKNFVTMPALLFGLILAAISGSFFSSLLGAIIPFIVLFPFWKIKGLGAGDIKLLMALGALLGLGMLGNYAVIIFAIAGLNIILIVATGGGIVERFKMLFVMLSNSVKSKTVVGYEPLSADNKGTFKLGYSIFLGYIVAYVLFEVVEIGLFFRF